MPCWARPSTIGYSASITLIGYSISTTCPVRWTTTPTVTDELAELQAAFAVSSWAARTPIDVEVPFDMVIGGRVVRGRIDAVFGDDDGGATVVDWKTGDPPGTPEAKQHAAVQLAVYRLAWAALQGCPVESVRASFHYVRSGLTVSPDDLPGSDDLLALLGTTAA